MLWNGIYVDYMVTPLVFLWTSNFRWMGFEVNRTKIWNYLNFTKQMMELINLYEQHCIYANIFTMFSFIIEMIQRRTTSIQVHALFQSWSRWFSTQWEIINLIYSRINCFFLGRLFCFHHPILMKRLILWIVDIVLHNFTITPNLKEHLILW